MTNAEMRFAAMMDSIQQPPASDAYAAIMLWSLAAAAVVSYGIYVVPGIAPPVGRTLPMVPFIAATAWIGRRCGRGCAWCAAAAALVLEVAMAIVTDYAWALSFWAWFCVIAIALCIVAWSSSRRSQPHPPDQSVGIGQGLLIRKSRQASFPALRQYVVK